LSEMEQERIPTSKPRQRVLLVTHCFDADFSMESRLSWFRARNAARNYDVTVLCAKPFADVRCTDAAEIPGVQVVTVRHTALEKSLIGTPVGFYLAYRLWHRRVFQVARRLHEQQKFALVHQVSYCGYREPGDCWKLEIPFVWGPIGGTQNVPWRFLGLFDAIGASKEAWRTLVNGIQLRLGRRVGQALRSSSKVFVANREIQQRFRDVHGVDLSCQLETGIQQISAQPGPPRDPNQPLRVLWAGRLENWKGLPLLLQAVSKLPRDFAIELRIVGSGSRERRLKRMARQLGIADRIDWQPLVDYCDRDHHYHWADVFAFTSLRDTSGTGLLESLAAGVPIVGLNHQGARDIMTDACAVPITVENPTQVVSSFQAVIRELAADPSRLQSLSRAALSRARNYRWEVLDAEMSEAYASVLSTPNGVRPKRRFKQEAPLRQSTSVAG
jgi:glycosyltransferase involved in cell wall biosynthesis